ncbi:MAG: hypothetical protein K2Z80_28360 [Xanthobacteraceae bacterium]|nr:hypothetical protein [Xanthobacteraceae bacterium]
MIDGCWGNGGTIFLSAVTAWEIALLVGAARIDLDIPVAAWVRRFLERPGIEAVPVGHRAQRPAAINCTTSSTAIRRIGS